MTFPLVCSNNLKASNGIWKGFKLWDLLSVECLQYAFFVWFVTSCRYHTMKCYIFNKWHGRLERSLDGISLSYNAPKKEWQLIMVCCYNIFFCGFVLCIKYAFVLFFNLCVTVCDAAFDTFDCLCPFLHHFDLSVFSLMCVIFFIYSRPNLMKWGTYFFF